MNLIVLWSGGKDSCLAYYNVIKQGHEVVSLLTFVNKYNMLISHQTHSTLLEEQAERMGVPITFIHVSRENYKETLQKTLMNLKKQGIDGVVFGYIKQAKHRAETEKLCTEAGLKALYPLWGNKNACKEFISEGFRAIIIKAKNKNWIGREINQFSDRELEIIGDGEGSQYHTYLIDGPIFK